jgi:hypothetical protein
MDQTIELDSHATSRSPVENGWRLAGWAIWLVALLVISGMVIANPLKRTVTPVYHQAVVDWSNHQSLYTGLDGMHYPPHFVPLFWPFHIMGNVVGDILWRCLAAAGIAAGLRLFGRAIGGTSPDKTFAILSLLVLPLALPALQNGQANAHLAAMFLLAAWCLKTRRFGRAAALLWLATSIKPIGIAAMGLAWAAYPQIWWRLALGLPVFLGFPFLFGPTAYAWSQCHEAWENLRKCADVTQDRFADLNGLLRVFGSPLVGKASLVVRAIGGAVLMCVCWRSSRCESELRRPLVWLGAATGFLMLFNPMTEANSYVMFAPVLGLMAWWEFQLGTKWAGWIFTFMALTMGLLPNLLYALFGNKFALAWHPAMTIGFLAIITAKLFVSINHDTSPAPAPVVTG